MTVFLLIAITHQRPDHEQYSSEFQGILQQIKNGKLVLEIKKALIQENVQNNSRFVSSSLVFLLLLCFSPLL